MPGAQGARVADADRRRKRATGRLLLASAEWSSFHDLAVDPASWTNKADELRMAARVLAIECGEWMRRARGTTKGRQSIRRSSPMKQYLLLSAFSIENYLKALVIRRKPAAVSKHQLERDITTHDLVDLYKRAGLRPSSSVRSFLELLTCAAVEFGRYPVPASSKRFLSHRSVIGDPVVEVERISRELRARLRRGPLPVRTGPLPRWRAPSGAEAISQSWQWT